ncbi:hypothetical protein NLJ89_g735 [Agrocybe chaxingu]|uniref:Enoyl reductase (ER) domain-containing protein n=1 Tax=Agrocybe chaxingu TaxID=84603 RepID=A0A9W8N1B6_9AGAR|nr:hypothetical protein NLJ89_g735 [Agrocybe chaxingu]
MRAARYYGPGDVRVEQIPEPEAKAGQVKVKVKPCVGDWLRILTMLRLLALKEWDDLHAYLAHMPKNPTLTKPNDLSGETLPITLGHEFSGTIVSLGEGVDGNLRLGQNVVIEPLISCRQPECYFCSHGDVNLCPSTNSIGVGGWGGGLAEYIAVDVRLVHKLPDGVPLEIGAMIEPLAVAWHAVKRSNFKDGQSVLILGAGPIGLFLLKVLRSFGPSSTVIVSEPAQIRRELASKHGATLAIDPLNAAGPIATAVVKATGIGADIAFDTTGVQAAVDTALLSVRPHGVFVNVAIWEDNPRMNLNLVVRREVMVTGSIVYRGDHPELLEAVAAGKLQGLEDLITRKIAIEDVVEQGFKALINEKDQQIDFIVDVLLYGDPKLLSSSTRQDLQTCLFVTPMTRYRAGRHLFRAVRISDEQDEDILISLKTLSQLLSPNTTGGKVGIASFVKELSVKFVRLDAESFLDNNEALIPQIFDALNAPQYGVSSLSLCFPPRSHGFGLNLEERPEKVKNIFLRFPVNNDVQSPMPSTPALLNLRNLSNLKHLQIVILRRTPSISMPDGIEQIAEILDVPMPPDPLITLEVKIKMPVYTDRQLLYFDLPPDPRWRKLDEILSGPNYAHLESRNFIVEVTRFRFTAQSGETTAGVAEQNFVPHILSLFMYKALVQ